MDSTGKKTDHKPKTKKAGTAGSGSVRLSVVGGGKENGAADTLSPEKTSAAAKEKSSQKDSVRKNSVKHVSGGKQESSAGKKMPAPGEMDAKKDTGKREDIKKEEIAKRGRKEGINEAAKEETKEAAKGRTKEETREETREKTKEGIKGGLKAEKTENKKEAKKENKTENKTEIRKENKKENKKERKTEPTGAAGKTAKKKLKKSPKGTAVLPEAQKGVGGQNAIPQDMPEKNISKKDASGKRALKKDASEKDGSEKSASEKNVSVKNASEKNASKKNTSKKNISEKNISEKNTSGKNASKKKTAKQNASERKPAAQLKEQTGKKTETKKAAGKSAAQTVPKAPGSAVSKTVPKKKGSSATRSRNPNLKLVKNEEFKTVKTRKTKKEPRRDTYEDKSYQDYDDTRHMGGTGIGEWFFQHKSLFIIGFTVFTVVAALAWGYYYVVTNYKVTTVYVDGNIHYSNEEIMDMVMTGAYGNNSLYLAMKYKDKGVEGVPFVEKMDVSILTPNTIRINVYEKALAGYVEYLGRYMYFDRDGIVVESSLEKTESIPQVTGLKFGYVVLNEALPVENDSIFKRILSITQLLDKYELMADRIYFNSDYDLTLYFDGVRVTLGSGEEIDEKVMRLQYILPELTGKSGTLSMENYTEDTKSIPFLQD